MRVPTIAVGIVIALATTPVNAGCLGTNCPSYQAEGPDFEGVRRAQEQARQTRAIEDQARATREQTRAREQENFSRGLDGAAPPLPEQNLSLFEFLSRLSQD